MGKRHVTISDKEYIVKNHKRGVANIAKELNLHPSTVYNWAKKLDVNVGRVKDINMNRGLRMFDAGSSCIDVMKSLHVSKSTADRWYNAFLYRTKRKEVLDYFNGDSKQPYWQTEQELIDSFNPTYSADELTGEERNIYLNKVASCRI